MLRSKDTEIFDISCFQAAEFYLAGNRIWHNFNEMPESQKIATVKRAAFGSMVVGASLGEELLFRGWIQNLILKQLPQAVLKQVLPGREELLDTKTAQVARIVFTSALFSAWHLQNADIVSTDLLVAQLAATFFMGLGLGALKESKAGLTGAIAAHMVNNAICVGYGLSTCPF